MRITHVIRGDDHVNNTPRQINILRALGAEPPVYAHVPTVLGADGAQAVQAPRRGRRDAVRGGRLPARGDGQLSRAPRLGARRRRDLHARRSSSRGSTSTAISPAPSRFNAEQAQLGQPGAHEADAATPSSAARSRRSSSARASIRRRAPTPARSRHCCATARRRWSRWPTRRATSTRRRSVPRRQGVATQITLPIHVALVELAQRVRDARLDARGAGGAR